MPSVLVQKLAELCRKHLLDEKWLIAPTRRIAHEWLDQVTRAGGPVVNVRVVTTRSMALEVLTADLAGGGMRMLSPAARRLAVAAAWDGAAGGYLGRARTTPRLLALAEQTVTDLRMAGLGPAALDAGRFEQHEKGRELGSVLAAYEADLKKRNLIDHADAMRLAAARLRAAPDRRGPDVVIVPDDLHLTGREEELLDALGERVVRLPVDPPAPAPQAVADGALRIVRAVGEINEVRQAFRTCVSRGLRLDEVEILYAATEPYVPLVYDTALRVFDFDRSKDLGVPVTFAEGVPSRLARPARLLAAWLGWIEDDFPQSTLLGMLQAGLLRLPVDEEGDPVGAARLSRTLRSLGIGFGRDRYLQCVAERVESLTLLVEESRRDPEDAERLRRRLGAAKALAGLLGGLLDASPPSDVGAAATVSAAVSLVRDHAATASGLDGLARQHLLQELGSMAQALADTLAETPQEPAGFDARQWLAELPHRLRVGGSGPRPGHLHVAPLRAGGHTGRPHTIVLGLDDARFPSAGYQDPLVLDAERARLGAGLVTSAQRLRRQLDDFQRLLGRLRGNVTLSYSARNLEDDSERFASPVVLAAYRILSGRRDGDHSDLATWLGPPASFAPDDEAACLDAGEWWLYRASQDAPVANFAALTDAAFGHLDRGRGAAAARASSEFTAFDGFVETPGAQLDPTHPEGPVLSATTKLQTLGRCPLAYYYRNVLRVRPPDDVDVDPQQWLTSLQYGTLLHEVLYEFVGDLIAAGEWPPQRDRDGPRIRRIVETHAARWRRRVPPPNAEAQRRRRADLDRAAEIFVNEQSRRGDRSRPVYLEATIGMPTEGRPTDIDAPQPVELALPGGGSIRVRGRIDRIDRRSGHGGQFVIWDYKSGSYTKSYDPPDVFGQGRLVQHVLYMAAAESVLRAQFGPEATVAEFIFLFPGARTHGRSIDFGSDIVPAGMEVIEKLCRLAAAGVFPATDDVDDCMFCDYRRACQCVCRDLETLCRSSRSKLADADNTALRPFVELRRG